MKSIFLLIISTIAFSAEFRQDSSELRLIVKDGSFESLNNLAETISKKIGLDIASIEIAELKSGISFKEKMSYIIIKSKNIININEQIPGILEKELDGYYYWENVKIYKDNV